ncbi:hypothetical protein SeMB42_g04419 [Synchytrium endobioticum]|uniref:Raptor N-terminal CASPase-like domain-containing protein n=1 Tax=Synchytrium endobioticum TaxID=286115 RepID=A0A507CY65_9FUNG|nr:hypothetical protein SeLEV6574_g07361 [Synchytrium endobioticum]TPX44134.1 hypothetical protein SeMB42_g04419 [Synchytrium endobioticum]
MSSSSPAAPCLSAGLPPAASATATATAASSSPSSSSSPTNAHLPHVHATETSSTTLTTHTIPPTIAHCSATHPHTNPFSTGTPHTKSATTSPHHQHHHPQPNPDPDPLPDGQDADYTTRYFDERRHEACARPMHACGGSSKRSITTAYPCTHYCHHHQQQLLQGDLQDWRMRERLKTVSGALVLCLNIGVDPPDIVKTSPCAKLECWVDPFSIAPTRKALEQIGQNLQAQYEAWQPKARYRLSLDPSVEETKKLCLNVRKNAKDERILFHYNGHGVPRPTPGGEIWVFNKQYTQYIPVSIYDLQSWLGSPCIFVFDCSNAGNILLAFNRFAEQRDAEAQRQIDAAASNPSNPPPVNVPLPYTPFKECIQLAACRSTEILPMNPDLPADLFSCCLTTPIEIALRWFITQNPLLTNITIDMIMKIPGKLNDRRTPLGELNWIFTAITDTIAWNVLPHDVFKKLFRQDLMVAALFRNFLLADRIMRFYNCTPMSSPQLQPTFQHPLWQAWDLAADMCLAQLPVLLAAQDGGLPHDYKPCSFFAEQLTAFEVWLSKGPISTSPPEQLPIVLQVLLSQNHRLRALMLLSRFLDLGPWAVHLALSVGIFPYVLKLLQSPAADLKPVLVFIWAKILAVDRSCQQDLLKDNGYTYFINILSTDSAMPPIPNLSEHRAMCSFILSVFCHNFRAGQAACLRNDLLPALIPHLSDPDPLLRQWACLSLEKLWEGYSDAKWTGIKDNVHEKLCGMLTDPVPEVRAAALFAVGALIGDLDKTEQVASAEQSIGIAILAATGDASPICRKELVVALSRIVQENVSKFVTAAYELIEEDRRRALSQVKGAKSNGGSVDRKTSDSLYRLTGASSVYGCLWKVLLNLSVDPFPDVSELGCRVVDTVNLKLLSSSLVESPSAVLATALPLPTPRASHPLIPTASSSPLPSNSRNSTTLSLSSVPATAASSSKDLKRSSSFVNTMRALTGFKTTQSYENISADAAAQKHIGGQLNGEIRRHTRPPSINSASYTSANSFGTHTSLGNSLHIGAAGSSTHSQSGSPITRDKSSDGASINSDKELGIPLHSSFFEWSCEYFAEPQYRLPEIEEPGSMRYTERMWRKRRNERLIAETENARRVAPHHRFDEIINILHSDPAPAAVLAFHQFEPHIAVADNQDEVVIYGWDDNMRLNTIKNFNPLGSRITSLRFINEDDNGLLLMGSDEGIIRIYRRYEYIGSHELVTAWRALTDLLPSMRGSGLVTDWQQSTGTLLVSGDVRQIRIWDVEREACVQDLPTKSQVCVTSLASDKTSGNLIVAGCGDGSIRLYDRRIASKEAHVAVLTDHRKWVVNVQLQPGSHRDVLSGSQDGDIRLWDLGQRKCTKTIEPFPGLELTALALHDNAALIACGSNSHQLRVYNTQFQPLGYMRLHDSVVFAPRAGPVSSIAFHAYKPILAAGSITGGSVTLFGQPHHLHPSAVGGHTNTHRGYNHR